MRSRQILLVVLLALITTAIAWLWGDESPALQELTRGQETAEQSTPPPEQGSVPPDRQGAPEEEQVEPKPPTAEATGVPTGFHGVVKEIAGGGLPGIRVEIVDAEGTVLASTISGENGQFEFERPLPPRASVLSKPVSGDGPTLRHRVRPPRTPGPGGRSRRAPKVGLWRPSIGLFEGTVVDSAGRPVAGASISTDRPISMLGMPPYEVVDGSKPEVTLFTKTDEKGRFSMRGQRQGKHRLVATRGDEQASGTFETGTTGIVLQLGVHTDGDIVLTGQVTDRSDGRPVAGVRVDVLRVTRSSGGWGSAWVARGRSDEEGRYEVQGLKAGNYALSTQIEGYAVSEREPQRYEHGYHTVDLVVDPARRVQVQVVLPGGAPAKGVKLWAIDANGKRLKVPTRFGPSDETKVDKNGAATLRGLPAASIEFVAIRGDFHAAGRTRVDLSIEPTEPVTITMPTAGRAFARRHYFYLLDEAGGPIEVRGTLVARAFDGAELVSRVEGHMRDGEHFVGNEQRHGFDDPILAVGAPAGACRVEIEAPGYQTEVLTLEAGATSPTKVRLRR